MSFRKVVDTLLFIYFLIITIAVILFDSQMLLPSHLYPNFLSEGWSYYTHKYNHHLVIEKPYFFLGLAAQQLLIHLPLSVANLHAIASKKSWFNTTCLIQGVSSFTALVAIVSELVGSQRASHELLMAYVPFVGFSLLAVLRGLVPVSRKTTSTHAAKSSAARKKRA